MPADPERIAEIDEWLAKANGDLRGASVDLAAAPPLTGDAMFHAQQATEKALKAYLSWHDVAFRKTHDIAELGRACVAIDPTLEAVAAPASVLTEFAWRFRYPGDAVEPEPGEAHEAVNLAIAVVAAVSERLGRARRSD